MITVAWVLIAIGAAISLAGFIMLVFAAFRTSVGWGLAMLFLSWLIIPLVIFLVKYWPEARTPFLVSVGGWVFTGIGWFVLAGSVATNAMAEFENFDVQDPASIDQPADDSEAADLGWNDEDSPEDVEPLQFDPPPPSPTPTVMPAEDYEELQEELAESAARKKIISFGEAYDHVGERVKVHLVDGTSVIVTIDAIDREGMSVTRRVGGGAVSFPIRRDHVKEIHLLK